MSVAVSVDRPPRLPVRRRPLALLAVAAGHVIGRLPPRRIHSILTICARGARPAGYAEARRARATVVAVSVRCAGEGCLPRSIATALLCRARGSWPTWYAGAQTMPFRAHAWVEAEGRPVDEPLSTTHLQPLVTIPPGGRPSPSCRTQSP
ncbi:lasso peptide biosynthesis B2 protein [Streptomyces hesseae]|uniref:Lasso peptide biosynthesis B2 protein n=1 Tax=Streptomyces hesseae TaxID=3075519 RepID=A0ABU2SWF2_9ACTN|nr:lasso peptide biosynthesis B2 protein [Streptomyces sp. DSM 40473]MDT0453175.1 lasso peptide biosynthesis B2 protein [Streptomyces sp. DSM 40473]